MQHSDPSKLNWDDFRFILAVARSGSFAAAAAVLGTSTPTVFRRARDMEQRIGTQLFRRDTTGVTLTAAGRDAAALAGTMELEIVSLEARIANEDREAVGTIRLATVDTLIAGPLMPVLSRFRQECPGICLDIRSGIGMADIRQRQVDAALRAGGEPPENLVGRILCRIAVALYCGRGHYASTLQGEIEREAPEDQEISNERELAAFVARSRPPFVVPGDDLKHLATARWCHDHKLAAEPALRANSLHTLERAVQHNMGLGLLPCYLADLNSDLVRLSAPIEDFSSDLWFLTHPELRETARVRALSDFLFLECRSLKNLFEGRAGNPVWRSTGATR
ncbi:LysR family transcriptional regulator [Roseibium sp. M-1]